MSQHSMTGKIINLVMSWKAVLVLSYTT